MTDQPLEPGEPTDRTEDTEQPTEAKPPPEPEQATEAKPPPEPAAARPSPSRKLYRSSDDRVIAGVCGGLGEYFGVDAVLVRIAFVVLVFAGGAGILAYVLAWIFIAEEPASPGAAPESTLDRAVDAVGDDHRGGAVVLGLVFVALGILFLLDITLPDFLSWSYLWPIALIAVGIAIVLRARR
jgi:phage shock protein C